jgi:glycosyltransferase involved in cell wall biosynthesis
MTKPAQTVPLVAIVTPVYNGAAFLAETMECVQKLDYPNLIHIVRDNASTDATPEIITRYQDRRVPVISARNSKTVPMAPNWNAAVAMVPKEAVFFRILCADDTLIPHAISHMMEVASRDPRIGIVGSLWRAEGLCGEELPKNRQVFDSTEVLRSFLRREHRVLNGPHSLIRCTQLDARQAYYDETIAGFDSDANIRACLNNKYGFVHEELCFCRIHEASETATYAIRTHVHLAEWLVLLDRYGPSVLGFREYLDCRRAYRRHYLRRLLLVRWRDKDKSLFGRHLSGLRVRDDAASWVDFVDAMAEFFVLALTARRDRVGISQRLPITDGTHTMYAADQIGRYGQHDAVPNRIDTMRLTY